MSKILVLQHVWCETLGTIAEALAAAGLRVEVIRPYEGQPVPDDLEGVAGLVVMGGPMSVYDHRRYAFLSDEMRLMERAVEEDKPILGVCLGSQLLAATLGAAVTKGDRKEIGWYPVTLTESARNDPLWRGISSPFVAYHWHGDVFELPRGAVRLASSELTACQAFRYGRRAYGFLFHMEVTEQIIRNMVATFADELREVGIDGREIVERAKEYLTPLQRVGRQVFMRWANLAGERST